MAKTLPVLIGATIASAALWSCMSGPNLDAANASRGEATQRSRTIELLPDPAPPPPADVPADAPNDAPKNSQPSAPVASTTTVQKEPTGPAEPLEPAPPTQPEAPAVAVPQPLQLAIPRGKDGSFPDAVEVDGHRLPLQGAGLCEWGLLGIDLSRAALDVEEPLQTATDAMTKDQRMVIHLDFVRELTKDQLCAAWRGSVEVNAKGDTHDHGPALQLLCESMRTVDDGDRYTFALTPNDGMRVLHNDKECAHIVDEAFRRLFVKLYLGPNPPTKSLRKAMLGGAK